MKIVTGNLKICALRLYFTVSIMWWQLFVVFMLNPVRCFHIHEGLALEQQLVGADFASKVSWTKVSAVGPVTLDDNASSLRSTKNKPRPLRFTFTGGSRNGLTRNFRETSTCAFKVRSSEFDNSKGVPPGTMAILRHISVLLGPLSHADYPVFLHFRT